MSSDISGPGAHSGRRLDDPDCLLAPCLTLPETFSIPLNNARNAKFKFSHGAGKLRSAAARQQVALAGLSAVGMNRHSQLNGDRLEVQSSAGSSFVPFLGPLKGRRS
jgi:hypothetical protein